LPLALLFAGMLATCVLVGAWTEPAKGAFPGTNGKLVVAARDTVSDDTEIFTMNPNGTGVVQLTHNKTYDDEPAWSPDGKKIAYSHLTQTDAGRSSSCGPTGRKRHRSPIARRGTRTRRGRPMGGE